MKLRDYQEAAVDSLFQYFNNFGSGNPIVALPTGTGKSVVIGAFIRRAMEAYPGTRIMKLTHVKELIEQNLDKLLAIWPTAPAGVYSSGLKRKDIGMPIIFGGVATVARSTPETFGHIDLLLIDECHLVSSKDNTMYQSVIRGLRKINPRIRVIGLTATQYRLGYGMLTEADGLFTDVCFDMTKMEAFNHLLSEGYLSRLVPKPTSVQLDVSDVHIVGGEFKQNELQAAVDKEAVTYAAVREMLAHGHDRAHWLIFASGIEHAVNVASVLNSHGISATCVHSKMPDSQRDAAILGFKNGKFRAMVNNSVLTTGFDFPGIDLIGMLRPTQSPGLWVQMLGRGTRPVYALGFDLSTSVGRMDGIKYGSKPNCLVLDFAGNTKRLGPINDPVLPKRKGAKGDGVAPVRLCESCGTYNHISSRHCSECGAEFPRDVKILQHAGTDELISDKATNTEIFKVDRVVYTEHRKKARPPSIQISYFCGLRMFKEWVCLQHDGYAGKKARDWWCERALAEAPETTAKALASLDVLREPTHIKVWLKTKYDEILAHDFTGTAFEETS